MITSGIFFKNFKVKKKNSKIKKNLKDLIKDQNHILQSLHKNYKDQFKIRNLRLYKKFKDIRIIGIGGSSLGAKAIYGFLRHKIKKNLLFLDNLSLENKKTESKRYLNLIVSKSGNTLETIKFKCPLLSVFLFSSDRLSKNNKFFLILCLKKL